MNNKLYLIDKALTQIHNIDVDEEEPTMDHVKLALKTYNLEDLNQLMENLTQIKILAFAARSRIK